MNRRGRR